MYWKKNDSRINRVKTTLLSSLCLLVILGLLTSCKETEDPEVEVYKGPVEEVHDVQLFYSEGGQLRVEVKTPLQYRYENENKVFPDTVNINFFDTQGTQVVTTLRSDSGHFDNAKNLYVVKGHVVVVNKQEQRQLNSPDPRVNRERAEIFERQRQQREEEQRAKGNPWSGK